jgi:gamma-glutamylcyclotransferase (GGCT)/AIG2-like uncharacterized protein YtfP
VRKGSLLFVYGTLRRGASSDLSREPLVEFVSGDSVNGKLYNLGWFPGVKEVACSGADAKPQNFDPGEASITGDVFRILDDRVVSHLDAYEGYPNLYNRVETETADGKHVWVYTYNHNVEDRQLIPSGDWIASQLVANPPANTAG